MGNDRGRGEQEIRELRSKMWSTVQERRHSVVKVFPASFQDLESEDQECELMLFGEVTLQTKDGQSQVVPWAGHVVLKKDKTGEKEECKFAHYRV
ncbi:putative Fungal specific transcription factor [Metarhizium brunneum]